MPSGARLMDNLITNAVKHNPDGVNVEVRVESRPGGAAIVVADQGVGMDEETRAICSSVTTGERILKRAWTARDSG